MNENKTPENSSDQDLENIELARRLRQRTRRSFLVALGSAVAGYGGLRWLSSRSTVDGVSWPLRKLLLFNENLSNRLYRPSQLARELPEAALTPNGPRVNGALGLSERIDAHSWRLHIKNTALAITLDEIKALPEVSQITPLNCIEGWTTVARWSGVRFEDFAKKFFPEGVKMPYVGMATPDGEYYVGLDAASAYHAQTLLCYSINGQPLSEEHGAPLRLLIPTKYGIKNLKRIGQVDFSTQKPRDYWAEQGYDWYAGF